MFASNETIISKDDGILIRAGRHAGTYKNICYLIENTETNDKYYKMTCNENNNIFTILSIEDYEVLKNYKPFTPVFSLHSIGYAFGKDPISKIQVWETWVGEIPDRMDILHDDNAPLCEDGTYRNWLCDLSIGTRSET